MIPCSLDIRTLNSTGFFLFTSSLWRRISFHNGRFWNQSCAKRGTHHSMRFSHGITTAMVGQNPLPFAESNAKKKNDDSKFFLVGIYQNQKSPNVFLFTRFLFEVAKNPPSFMASSWRQLAFLEVWRWQTCWNRRCLAAWMLTTHQQVRNRNGIHSRSHNIHEL